MRSPALMQPLAFRLIIVFVWLLVVPRAVAAAEGPRAVDFDGDGRRDEVVVDHREPSALRISLSASGTTQMVRGSARLLWVVARDIDGDHRPELIATDTESRIYVWTRKRNRFQSYRPRSGLPDTLKLPSRRSVDEDDDSKPVGIVSRTAFVPPALPHCTLPYGAWSDAFVSSPPHPSRAHRSFPAADPFAPRPPPSPFLL